VRLTYALRDLLRQGHLTPGMLLPGVRKLSQQLQHLGIGTEAVRGAYRALGAEGLLVSKGGAGTWVAGSARRPLPDLRLPDDWPAGLQRALEEHPLFEETLREYVVDLPSGTLLPSAGQVAELLKEVPGASPPAVREAYDRLAGEGLLATDDNASMRVAHTARPAAEPRPRLPFDWVEQLRHTLECTPKPAGGRVPWLAQALRTHIAPLPPGTRLPAFRELSERLKDLGIPSWVLYFAYR
jgi:DNA-binding FadR family transcriptional regulator